MEEAKYGLPKRAWTDNPDNVIGNARLRVEEGLTSFYTGRQFRTYKEISLASGQVFLIKIVSTTDFILHELSAVIDSGALKVTTYAGGTTSGTFSETMPIIAKNGMSSRPTPVYTSKLGVTAVPTGGTISGGIELDILRVVAPSATSQQSTVTGVIDSRGIPAGTFYLKIENINNGTTTGVIRAFWGEE